MAKMGSSWSLMRGAVVPITMCAPSWCTFCGDSTHRQFYGGAFALPNMGEKGYMDIKVSVNIPLGAKTDV